MLQIRKDNTDVTYEAIVIYEKDDGTYEELSCGDGWDSIDDALEYYIKMAQALGNKTQTKVPYELVLI